jgi:uncharacterized membrane protein YhaH (DUF805 family)
MTFVQAIKSVFAKYASLNGRARRAEYWWFYLFVAVVNYILSVLSGDEQTGYNVVFLLISLVFGLGTLIPILAVTTRRLHDTNRSGWRQLWVLTIIGIIPLIYWLCQRGTDGPNRFGPDPLSPKVEDPLHS